MSHYDVKFLAWLSTNLLLSRKGKKSEVRGSGVWQGKSIAEKMGGPLYGRMMREAQGRFFDGLWVKKEEPLLMAREGWESDIYVRYRGALRRARLLRAEIWNEYGSYGGHTVSYLLRMTELGEVWLHEPFAYAASREDAEAGKLSRVGERPCEQHDIAVLSTLCFLRENLAGAVNIGAAWTIVRYTWDAKLGCAVQHPIVTGPIVTTDGRTFRIERTWFPAGTFPTKKACEAAQKKEKEDEGERRLPVVE
ncbi:MAG: hypothetical protein IJ767_04245 [Bacteroidaceae bacterium]|nr:hypothetical protein [Bacteroidaceae bacterium]